MGQDLTEPHSCCCNCGVGEAQLVPGHHCCLQLLGSEVLYVCWHVHVSNSCTADRGSRQEGGCERQADSQQGEGCGVWCSLFQPNAV